MDDELIYALPETTDHAINRTKWRIEDLRREFDTQERRIKRGEQIYWKNFDPLDIGREENILAILKSVKARNEEQALREQAA